MHQTRSIRFIRREDLGDWRLKVYGIGTHAPDARPEFVAATLEVARTTLPEGGGAGFVIARDAKTAGLALVYWWANDNEIHDGTGLACVWELEVIDFERRAWLADVLENDDLDAYLARRMPDAEI